MKDIHYRNIGFPKTGTNWLWYQLGKHPQIDGRFSVEYKEYRPKDVESYKKIYKDYRITYNLDTHVFTENFSYLRPESIHEYTTHITLIFRNPYEVLNSMYNMNKNNNPNFSTSKDEYTNVNSRAVCQYGGIGDILNYWKSCKLPVKYMIYDDLQNDPKSFMHEICDHLGLRHFCDTSKGVTFPTKKNDPLVFDNIDTIEYINRGISVIENQLNRDLSHWKK
jgi:hypothetical protein